MERLGVIGSREFAAREWLFSLLDDRRGAHGDFLVIAPADQPGVPRLAVEWARERGLGHEEINPAKVLAMADRVLAVTLGVDGETEGLVSRARAAGKGVIMATFEPSGEPPPEPSPEPAAAGKSKAATKKTAAPQPAPPSIDEEEDDDL